MHCLPMAARARPRGRASRSLGRPAPALQTTPWKRPGLPPSGMTASDLPRKSRPVQLARRLCVSSDGWTPCVSPPPPAQAPWTTAGGHGGHRLSRGVGTRSARVLGSTGSPPPQCGAAFQTEACLQDPDTGRGPQLRTAGVYVGAQSCKAAGITSRATWHPLSPGVPGEPEAGQDGSDRPAHRRGPCFPEAASG